ncbi:MAG: outer membrane beta-barrel protein [Pseudomonadota bacterium]
MQNNLITAFISIVLILGSYQFSHAGGAFDTIPQKRKFQFGVYGGHNDSFDSDVSLNESGTNVSLDDVEWDGDSFGDAPYWGIRLTYWPDSYPNWGFMVDYTHAKIKAETSSGTSSSGNVGNVFDRLEFTDGLNLLTFNGVYRYDYSETIKPYAGAGIGFAFPHVEVEQSINNAPVTMEYQVTGVAAQILAGLEWNLDERFALFSEYKLSYADVDADLDQGGTLETEAFTNHFIFGLSYKFGLSDDLPPLK